MTDYDNAIVAFINWCKAEKRDSRLRGDEGGEDTFFAYETEQRWKVWLASWLARTPQPDAAAIRKAAWEQAATVAYEEVYDLPIEDSYAAKRSYAKDVSDAIRALSTTLVEPAIPTPSDAIRTATQDAPSAINGDRAAAHHHVQICKLGMMGRAYDTPGESHRAYTYDAQPDNVGAWRLGDACRIANEEKACGDFIDRGLILLRELQAKGFGVFDIAASPIQSKDA